MNIKEIATTLGLVNPIPVKVRKLVEKTPDLRKQDWTRGTFNRPYAMDVSCKTPDGRYYIFLGTARSDEFEINDYATACGKPYTDRIEQIQEAYKQ